jgi:hypothetical protein
MSTSSASTSQRPYPLSPPPNTESKRPQEASVAQPQTPQSPSYRASGSIERTSSVDIVGPAVEKGFPTPANSINGSAQSFDVAEGALTMTDNSRDVVMETEDFSNKRKRDVEDVGSQEQKKVHVEDRRLGIEDLHLDVGKKYLLCRTRKAPTSLAYYSFHGAPVFHATSRSCLLRIIYSSIWLTWALMSSASYGSAKSIRRPI